MKTTDNVLKHTRSAPVRNSTLSTTRQIIEAHMKLHPMEPINTSQAAELAGVPRWKAGNIMSNMKTEGKVRAVGTEAGRIVYVWHTSPLRPAKDRPADMAQPRTHVNASQPTGNTRWWGSFMARMGMARGGV